MADTVRPSDWVGDVARLGAFNDAKAAARALYKQRRDRNKLVMQVLTGTWTDYLSKPDRLLERIWNAMRKRFTVCNLAHPVLGTITSAAYGGRVTRKIRESVTPVDEIESFMTAARYRDVVKKAFSDACAYGTGYMYVGFNGDRPVMLTLPAWNTEIQTPDDDASDVRGVTAYWPSVARRYAVDGVFDQRENQQEKQVADGMGFLPVTIGRAKHQDASSPYGESLIWPAVAETVQTTYLGNDLMVLARSQSFSTLVVKGTEIDDKNESGGGPFAKIRLDSQDPASDAKFISPDAKVSDLNSIIESKFQRVAAQCNVPIELFAANKAGVSTTTGGAWLTHKPLYDMVVGLQHDWKEVETDCIARIDALLQYRKSGGSEIDLDKTRDILRVDVNFENEVNPSYTQSDAQTWQMLMDMGVVTFEDAYEHFHPDATDDEIAEARAEKDSASQRAADAAMARFPVSS